MEVHHAHAPGEGKKHLKHYLFEFLMLFLAVTAGFFAENVREHSIEGKREKEYIRSIIEDLKLDTAWLNQYLSNQRISIQAFDSVILLLNQPNRDQFRQQRTYLLARIALRFSDFPTIYDYSYDQMKNSGNLRLIHKQMVANKISQYYFHLKDMSLMASQLLLRHWGLIEFEGKIFDGNIFQGLVNRETFEFTAPTGNPPLITEDKKTINEFIVRAHYIISIMLYSKNATLGQIKQATELIIFLKNEYRL